MFMVKVVTGAVIGFTAAVWFLALDSKYNYDSAIAVNIVIAVATIYAVVIHYDSVRKQRRDRVWEINKDNLLSLSKTLSDSISINSKLSEQEFCKMQGIPDETCTDGAYEINTAFQQSLSDSLNVYKPLLNEELITAIEKYQTAEKLIEEDYNCDAIVVFEAYERQWSIQKELHQTVSAFIKKVAGI